MRATRFLTLFSAAVIATGFFISATTAAPGEKGATLAGRALPFIVDEGIAWMEERECVSCHQVPYQLWSLRSAAREGLAVDAGKLAEWTEWSIDWRRWNNEKARGTEAEVVAGNVDTIAALLMGRDRRPESTEGAWVGGFVDHLVKTQAADGSWKAGGQRPLAKLPPREVAEITTRWAMEALRSVGDKEKVKVALEKAQAWLAAGKTTGLSTEWHALRLLSDATTREALLALQKPDGGWGWLASDPPDALGTGIALYALARDGVPFEDPAIQRAVRFLESTQRPDGSWPVPSTRAKDKNKIAATSSYWGTAWAVIGLLEFRQPVPTSGGTR